MSDGPPIEPLPTGSTVSPGLPQECPSEPPPLPVATDTVAQKLIARREQLEGEFNEVKRVVVFYAAMLGPLLGLLAWVYHTKHDTLLADYWGGGILYFVIGGFAWLWRHELHGKFSWPQKCSVKTWLAVAVTPLVTVASAYLWSAVATRLGVPEPHDRLLEKNWSVGFAYGWIAVLPAFFEEIAFRGLLLTKLQRLMGPVQAAWVTAILFGVLHFNVFGLAVFLVPLALVAAWLTHRTQSLWPAILLHFLHNATVVTLTLLA